MTLPTLALALALARNVASVPFSGGPYVLKVTPLSRTISIRQGDWEIAPIGHRRLFNLARDPGETNDPTRAAPARLAALVKKWDAYAARVGVVLSDPPLHPAMSQPEDSQSLRAPVTTADNIARARAGRSRARYPFS